MMHECTVSAADLMTGMVLAEDVTFSGQIILRKGTELSKKTVETLKDSVYLKEFRVAVSTDKIRFRTLFHGNADVPENAVKAYLELKKMFDLCRVQKGLGSEDLKRLQQVLSECTGKNISFLKMMLRSSGVIDYDAAHALNTALLTSGICDFIGLSQAEKDLAVFSAALADIGKAAIDPDLLQSSQKLSARDFSSLRQHVFRSVGMLKNYLETDAEVIQVLSHHHERLDGSGYPGKISGEKIHPLGTMIGLCDSFDAMLSDRPYRRGMSPAAAVREILNVSGVKFRRPEAAALFRLFTFYPPGTVLILNTGEKALVTAVNSEKPLKPMVRVFSGRDGRRLETPYDIDLSKELSVFVLKIIDSAG